MKKITLVALSLALILFSCKKPQSGNTTGASQLYDLYDFNSTHGANPYGGLVHYFGDYGMTSAGGAYGQGVVFNLGDTFWVMHNFAGGTADGATPMGDLILIDTTLYGMTSRGGANGQGIIFSINVLGSGYRVLYNFGSAGTGGVYPNGSLTAVGNLLYGMTSEGGAPGNGNIFSFNISNSTYTDIFDFAANGKQGVAPGGNVIVSGNTLYGMAYLGGGSDNDGVVFSVSTTGTNYTKLVTFTGTNGANPQGSLLLSNGTIYGTTSAGGAYGGGNLFSVSTSGSGFADLYDFNGNTGPTSPYCTLIMNGSTLYGTATGGADVGGYVFSVGTTGSGFTNLCSFNLGNNGSSPHGGLSLDVVDGGGLRGMTYAGGKYGYGTIYEVNPY